MESCVHCDEPATFSIPAPWGKEWFCSEKCLESHSEEVEERDAERYYGGK